MKKILLLSGGAYNVRAIERIRNSGLFEVLAVDRDAAAPGLAMAHRANAIDISNVEAVCDWARAEKIDGVMPMNDSGIAAADQISRALGLIGNGPVCARTATDKAQMRRAWNDAGVPVPRFAAVTDWPGAQRAAATVGFPLVMKPALTAGGGRGISVVQSAEELQWAFDFATPHAANGVFVVEQFIDGLELTVEYVSVAGRHTLLAVSDKVKPNLRTRVATSLNYSAAVSEETWLKLQLAMPRVLDTLNIRYGISHTEVIVNGDGDIYMVETGARPGGGHIFHTLIESVSGISAPVLNAQILTGEQPDIPVALRRGGVYRFLTPPRGILRGVRGLEEVRAMPGVDDVGITANIGELVGDLPNSLKRAGFVVTHGATREEAIRIADAVERAIIFDVDSVGGSDPYLKMEGFSK